jgi:hypothetical protein
VIKHLVPRHILLSLLDSHSRWHHFKSQPQEAAANFLADELHRVHSDPSLSQNLKNDRCRQLHQLQSLWSQTFDTKTPPELKPVEKSKSDQLIEMLPSNIQQAVTDFLPQLLQSSSISWTSNGNLCVNGNQIPGSNIGDVLHVLMRSSGNPPGCSNLSAYWKRRNIVGLQAFLTAYSLSSLPSSLIRNAFFAGCVQKLRGKTRSSSFFEPWQSKMLK